MVEKNTEATATLIIWLQSEKDPGTPPLFIDNDGADLLILRDDGSELSRREWAGCSARLAAWVTGGRR